MIFGTNVQKVYLGNQEINKILLQGIEVFSSITTDPYSDYVTLLLHMNGLSGSQTFIDSSTNNFELTAFDNTNLSTVIKKYGTASVYFDGSGDYLEAPLDTAFDFGSENFTIECWFYSNISSWQTLIARWGSGGNSIFVGVQPAGIGGGGIQFYLNNAFVVGGGSINPLTWYHVAIVRNGSNITYFLNGVLIQSVNWSSEPINSSTEKLRIGFDNNINPHFNGYIDDVRITKGIARYTANFTPPNAQLPNPSDPYGDKVSLLLHMDGLSGSTTFIDSSSNNFTLSAFGDAQISTVTKKFGSGSGYFDGNGDYITVDNNSNLNFNTTDNFTIEGWIRFNSLEDGVALVSKGSSNTNTGWTLYYYQGFLYFGKPHVSNDISGTFTPSLNTWYHLACTRNSNTIRLFVDGSQIASSSNSIEYPTTENLRIGYSHSNNFLNGYIDDLRITKGIARYTSNFTPPTAPFPNP